jgi:hypothetical protein
MMSRTISRALGCFCLLVCVGMSYGQALTYTSGGFESPRFTAGNLVGQDSTGTPPNGAPPGGWVIPPSSTSPSTAVVQTTGGNPNQAVLVTKVGTAGDAAGDQYWAVKQNLPSPTTVAVKWDMNVTATGLSDPNFGPFFGVASFDQTQTNQPLGTQKRIATFGVDASSKEILIQDPVSGSIDVLPGDNKVTTGVWHTYEMVLNYNGAGGGSYSLYLDDPLRLSAPLYTSPTFIDSNFTINNFTSGAIATFGVGTGLGTIGGTALFDNYSITVTPVPEPSSIALGSVAVMGLVYRLRRRSVRQKTDAVGTELAV